MVKTSAPVRGKLAALRKQLQNKIPVIRPGHLCASAASSCHLPKHYTVTKGSLDRLRSAVRADRRHHSVLTAEHRNPSSFNTNTSTAFARTACFSMSDDNVGCQPQDKFNPLCETFDASLAIHAPDSVQAALPTARDRSIFRKAGPLNNLSACASLSTAPFRLLRAAPVRQPLPTPGSDKPPGQRKRTRREAAISGSIAPRHGVLAQMHRRQAEKSGPLSLLERAVRLRRRVRVVVRETHAIRGDVTGLVVAFDKHFNLVLVQAAIRDKDQPLRTSKQLFVRGENVVLVALE